MSIRNLLTRIAALLMLWPLNSGCDASKAPETEPASVGPELEARRQEIRKREASWSPGALARKERSIAILKSRNLPILDTLPVIEDESQANLRSREAATNRAMVLCIIASRAEGLDINAANGLIDKFGIRADITPNELMFLGSSVPSDADRTDFYWRYEAYWVLLWALGFEKGLAYPTEPVDPKVCVRILRDAGPDGFRKKANLRPIAEILDQADLIYRIHWAIAEARHQKSPAPGGLNSDVVMERHRVLNWLIGHMKEDWDSVSTDT